MPVRSDGAASAAILRRVGVLELEADDEQADAERRTPWPARFGRRGACVPMKSVASARRRRRDSERASAPRASRV